MMDVAMCEEEWVVSVGLIYKMLCRNHPKFDFTTISRIFVRLIHRMNVRTENAHHRCEIYESQMILNLRATEWFQLSAL